MKYYVWSRHVPEVGEPFNVLETVCTDRKVAEEDQDIISSIFYRKAWVEEVEK